MRIIILAAGKGERMMPLTRNSPKPLLELGNGRTLLEEQIESVKKSQAIDEIVLVIGYLAEQIEAKIKTYNLEDLKITTLYNPFYGQSNNLMTLWFSKHYMDNDFIITNGDNIFDYHVFQKLVRNNSNGIFLTTNLKRSYDEDDMKVILKDKKIIQVSKLIENKTANAESVGLVLVSGKKYRNIFKETLELLARDKEYLNKYWLEVFNKLSEKCVDINSFDIDGSKQWREIDFHLDLERAKKLMKIPIKKFGK